MQGSIKRAYQATSIAMLIERVSIKSKESTRLTSVTLIAWSLVIISIPLKRGLRVTKLSKMKTIGCQMVLNNSKMLLIRDQA
jgi:hypothetical protein